MVAAQRAGVKTAPMRLGRTGGQRSTIAHGREGRCSAHLAIVEPLAPTICEAQAPIELPLRPPDE
jgi:hypothetical protein